MDAFLNCLVVFFVGIVAGPLVLILSYPIKSDDDRVIIKTICYLLLGFLASFLGYQIAIALALGLYTGHFFWVYSGLKHRPEQRFTVSRKEEHFIPHFLSFWVLFLEIVYSGRIYKT